MADKLARVGLIPKPEPQTVATLDAFLTAYIVGRTDVKPLTTRHLNDARRNLVAFFGASKALADDSPGDADDFRRNLPCRNSHKHECTGACHPSGFHSLRRGYATLNADRMSASVLQRKMRHRSYKTTRRYIELAEKMQTAAEVVYVPEFMQAGRHG